MKSRGFAWSMSDQSRRGITLSWLVLFVLSIMLQYGNLTNPTPVDAVHLPSGSFTPPFQLDGNFADGGAGDDASSVFGDTSSAFASRVLVDAINSVAAEHLFTGGDTKDDKDIPSWNWTTGPGVQDKNDIENAFAAAYIVDGDLIVYFGADRYAANGEAQFGFWFLQGSFAENANGTFAGAHQVGDLLVQIDFENGGTDPVMRIYEWVGSGGDTNGTLNLLGAGGSCATTAAADTRCVIANTVAENPSIAFDRKFENNEPDDSYAGGSYIEGGINLTDLGLEEGCFSTFIVETRSSHTPDSTLSDYISGSFPLCETPSLTTQVSGSSISVGIGSVTDTASLTGTKGPVTGAVDFFLCGPTGAAADCATGGVDAGQDKAVNGSGDATSNAMSPTTPGWYCFRAEYTPVQGSKYLATSHTNNTTECFQVLAARIDVHKTADEASVSAGEDIGFTVRIENDGAGSATGVTVTDNLPGGSGVLWFEDPDAAGWSISGAAGSQVLSFGPATLAPGAFSTVHISSNTTSASCKVYDNTANASSTNDGEDSASASTEVICLPDLQIEKSVTPTAILGGQTSSLTYTIRVFNNGLGPTLFDVLVSDSDITTQIPAFSGLLTITNVTCSVVTLNSCDAANLTGSGINVGQLAATDGTAGGSDEATITVTVSASPNTTTDLGTHTNTAYACPVSPEIDAFEFILSLVSEVDLCVNDDASVSVSFTPPPPPPPPTPTLTIDKSYTGNTGGTASDGTGIAKVGDTLTYTLAYDLTNGPVTNGVITDVIPNGLAYVTGSATNNDQFTFVSYNAGTRTLTWTAPTVTKDGSVTYRVTVQTGSFNLPQPLVNTATVDSTQTPPDDDTASVLVQVVLAATATPRLTLAPTDAIDSGDQAPSSPGFGLMLALLVIAGIGLLAGHLVPTPGRTRRETVRRR